VLCTSSLLLLPFIHYVERFKCKRGAIIPLVGIGGLDMLAISYRELMLENLC